VQDHLSGVRKQKVLTVNDRKGRRKSDGRDGGNEAVASRIGEDVGDRAKKSQGRHAASWERRGRANEKTPDDVLRRGVEK